MFRRHARSISVGDASRTGRSLRWTRTPATWLPLGSSPATRGDMTSPARTLTAWMDSPGSCSFIAYAAPTTRSAAASVVPNGVPTGRAQVHVHSLWRVHLCIEEDDPHRLGADQQQREQHQRGAGGQRRRAMANGPRHGRHHGAITDAVDPDAHAVLQRAQRFETPAALPRKVGRQDEERLEQRHRQHEERDIRKYVHQLRGGRGDEEERHEREQRGAGADGYRTHHRPCARRGRRGPALAVVAFGGDALPHDEGVVHDEAHHQEEPDQRRQVQRQARGVEEQQGADERERDADRYPRRGTQVEHQEEQGEDEDRAGQPVSGDRRQPGEGPGCARSFQTPTATSRGAS